MQDTEKIWDSFAKEDAKYYIHTGFNKNDDDLKFFESGIKEVEYIISNLETSKDNRLLELGCGIGRMSVHFSKYFKEVMGVDISSSMISKAKEIHKEISNLSFLKVSGSGKLENLDNSQFGAVVSWHVLQHIPNYEVIKTYLSEIYRVAKPGAKIFLHFDTRPNKLLSALLSKMPPFLNPIMPRNYRYGMRRYRRNLKVLINDLTEIGFTILEQQNNNTDRQIIKCTK